MRRCARAGVRRIHVIGNGTSYHSALAAATLYRRHAGPGRPRRRPAHGRRVPDVPAGARGRRRRVGHLGVGRVPRRRRSRRGAAGARPDRRGRPRPGSTLDGTRRPRRPLRPAGRATVPVMTKTFAATLVATELVLAELLGGERADADPARDPSRRRPRGGRRSRPRSHCVAALAERARRRRATCSSWGAAALTRPRSRPRSSSRRWRSSTPRARSPGRWPPASRRSSTPDRVVIALAPDGPGRAATLDVASHAADVGRARHRGGPGVVRRRPPTLLPIPAAAEEDHAPLTAVPPVALLAFALARRRGHDPDHPGWVERYHSQGLRHILGVDAPPRRIEHDHGSSSSARAASSSPATCSATSSRTRSSATPRSCSTTSTPTGSRTAERMARWTADALGAAPVDRAATSTGGRRSRGADFVINTIQVGGARATQLDFDIPGRYGLRYTINDTINVGGVLRGLRTIPVVLGHRRRHGGGLPGRAVPQLHEPDGDARPGRRRGRRHARPSACATRCTGPSTRSPATSACRSRRSTRRVGGRQPPRLDPPPRAPRAGTSTRPSTRSSRPAACPTTTSSARTCSAGSGCYPTESSEHHAEYNPWFIPKGDLVERVPRPDRRVPRPGRAQPRRVRRDEAPAGRRRAVRDRAQRRVRGGDRPRDDDRRAGPDRRQRPRTTAGAR